MLHEQSHEFIMNCDLSKKMRIRITPDLYHSQLTIPQTYLTEKLTGKRILRAGTRILRAGTAHKAAGSHVMF